jgi:hypothetical protein
MLGAATTYRDSAVEAIRFAIGTIPVPISKDKCPPVARREKIRLARQGATIFKKEATR